MGPGHGVEYSPLHVVWYNVVRMFHVSSFLSRPLPRALSQVEKVKIQMRTAMEIMEFQTAIRAKYSLLQNVYCAADGLKLYLEQ